MRDPRGRQTINSTSNETDGAVSLNRESVRSDQQEYNPLRLDQRAVQPIPAV